MTSRTVHGTAAVSLPWEPTDNLRITPRVIYQKISVDGFIVEEF